MASLDTKPERSPKRKRDTGDDSPTISKRARTNERAKVFPCEVAGCAKKFTTRSNLLQHVKLHQGVRPFRCSVGDCDRSYIQRSHLIAHLKTHRIPEGGEFSVKCTSVDCPSVFSSVDELLQHEIKFHSNKLWACTFPGCGKAFTQKGNLVRHAERHKGETPPSTATNKNQEEKEDGDESNNRSAGNSTALDEEGGEEEPVAVKPSGRGRGRGRGRGGGLRSSGNANDTRWRCVCSGCNKLFDNKAQLIEHMKVKHHVSKIFPCPIEGCRKLFIRQGNLKHHVEQHMGTAGNITCPVRGCTRTFSRQCHLSRHLAKHSKGESDSIEDEVALSSSSGAKRKKKGSGAEPQWAKEGGEESDVEYGEEDEEDGEDSGEPSGAEEEYDVRFEDEDDENDGSYLGTTSSRHSYQTRNKARGSSTRGEVATATVAQSSRRDKSLSGEEVYESKREKHQEAPTAYQSSRKKLLADDEDDSFSASPQLAIPATLISDSTSIHNCAKCNLSFSKKSLLYLHDLTHVEPLADLALSCPFEGCSEVMNSSHLLMHLHYIKHFAPVLPSSSEDEAKEAAKSLICMESLDLDSEDKKEEEKQEDKPLSATNGCYKSNNDSEDDIDMEENNKKKKKKKKEKKSKDDTTCKTAVEATNAGDGAQFFNDAEFVERQLQIAIFSGFYQLALSGLVVAQCCAVDAAVEK